MKRICKIALILLIIFNIYSLTFDVKALDIWGTGDKFLDVGSGELDGYYDTAAVNETFSYIIDFLWGIGLLIIFISTVILGIKYMLVLPNEKSRLKQATTPYIAGVVIIFGALTIWKLVIDVLEKSALLG